MPKTKGLTLKQQKWLAIYIETGNATEAARRAYNCNERTARQIGHENLTKPDFSKFLDALGMNDLQLIKRILEGLDATKLIKAKLIVQKDSNDITNAQLREAAKELNGIYMEIPDWSVRHRYLETVLKLRKPLEKDFQEQKPVPIKWEVPTASV